MPAHRKLLPRPCPQCGQENGGMQIVVFNPEFNLNGRGIGRNLIYPILRISHYSKENYALTPKKLKSKRTKVWHNFQIHLGRIMGDWLDEIFDDPLYADKQSITVPLSNNYYNSIKNHGWSMIIKDRPHWINKDKKLKRCQECLIYSKLPLRKYDSPNGYPVLKNWWLCESCYAMRMERVTKWKEQKLLTTQKIASNI